MSSLFGGCHWCEWVGQGIVKVCDTFFLCPDCHVKWKNENKCPECGSEKPVIYCVYCGNGATGPLVGER